MSSSFIICTMNRTADLQNCLNSIVIQTILPIEVIIVDASSDSISAENQKNCKDILGDIIKLIYIKSTPSTTRQRNIGVDNACGDIVFFLDDDVILQNEYHKRILEVYKIKKDQNLGGVRGSFENFEMSRLGTTFRKLFYMNRMLKDGGKSWMLPSMNFVDVLEPPDIIEVECVPTSNCSFYRRIFNEFRFDEKLDKFAFGEDKDLSYRVSRKYNLFQTPYALLVHNKSPISRSTTKDKKAKEVINRHYIAKKHIHKGTIKWLAYYWSVLGDLIYSAFLSFTKVDSDYIIGTLEGIKTVMIKSIGLNSKKAQKGDR